MNENVKYIHCKNKEEAEWFFNIVTDITSTEYFEIYNSCTGNICNKSFIFGLFDTPSCFEKYFNGLYFGYSYHPLKVVLVTINEIEHPEDISEASDLMKKEEVK